MRVWYKVNLKLEIKPHVNFVVLCSSVGACIKRFCDSIVGDFVRSKYPLLIWLKAGSFKDRLPNQMFKTY